MKNSGIAISVEIFYVNLPKLICKNYRVLIMIFQNEYSVNWQLIFNSKIDNVQLIWNSCQYRTIRFLIRIDIFCVYKHLKWS